MCSTSKWDTPKWCGPITLRSRFLGFPQTFLELLLCRFLGLSFQFTMPRTLNHVDQTIQRLNHSALRACRYPLTISSLNFVKRPCVICKHCGPRENWVFHAHPTLDCFQIIVRFIGRFMFVAFNNSRQIPAPLNTAVFTTPHPFDILTLQHSRHHANGKSDLTNFRIREIRRVKL